MPDSNQKPPARPIFRKLSWVIAAISLFCALVAMTGFMGDDRLFGTLMFLFCGFLFTTIALTGHWSMPAAKEVSRLPGSVNLLLAMMCLLFFLQGVDEVMNSSFLKRLLGGLMVIAGGVGAIANLMVFLKQRKQAKQKE